VITIVYWLIFIGTMDVPAFWFIAFKLIIIDNIIAATGSNIAYNAHLAGYAFGAVAILLLLMTRLLEPTEIDLWQVIRLWNRRRQYRDVVSSGYNPFAGLRARRIRVKEIKKTPEQRASAEKVESLRTEINRRMSERNLPEAARAYLELVSIDATQLPPRQYLLDIANQLASEGRAGEAAAAYEKFLAHYGNYEYVDQVQLMLGLLYSRYLDNSQKAVEHLLAAEQRLSDAAQLRMCREEMERLKG
jgi:tetratricopeptide (TPR) repeat protein